MSVRHLLPSLPEEDLRRILSQLSYDDWQRLSGRRIFITGGTGFVGKWLLGALIEANRRFGLGVTTTVLSRDPEAFRTSAPSLANAEGVSLTGGDVRNFTFPEGGFDTVIHAATDVSAELEPEDLFDTCIAGTRRVLDLAVGAGTQDFLLISSGAVYGRQPPDVLRVSETYAGAPDPLLLGSAYGEGKRASEWLCAATRARTGMRVRSARCFAFVGPYLPLDKHFAIGNFINAALEGREIIIQGNGTPLRSYLYAADMAAWLCAVLIKGRSGAAYNIGADAEISIGELAHRVARLLESSSLVRILGKHDSKAPVERYVPDNRLALTELCLSAPIPLDEAIIRTASWHRTRCVP